jgi:hypothetical protein
MMGTSKRSTKRSTGGKRKTDKVKPYGLYEHGCLRDKFNRTHMIACAMHQRLDPEFCPTECEWRTERI